MAKKNAENLDKKSHSYSEAEYSKVAEHISKYYGPFEVYESLTDESTGQDIDIVVVKPDESARINFYSFITIGLGAEDYDGDRFEITLYLPSEWHDDKKKWSKRAAEWPLRLLRQFINYRISHSCDRCKVFSKHTQTGLPKPLGSNTTMSGAILVHQCSEEMEECSLGKRKSVSFLSLFPLYEDEASFAEVKGIEALMRKIDDDLEVINVSPLTIERTNIMAPDRPKFWLKGERQVLDEWDQGPYCRVSLDIMCGNKPIAVMQRERPDEKATMGWDSGWIFKPEGDDDCLPLQYDDRYKWFELNTVCNVDKDVLPLLSAPYGSVYKKKDKDSPWTFSYDRDRRLEHPSGLKKTDLNRLNKLGNNWLQRLSELERIIMKAEQRRSFAPRTIFEMPDLGIEYAYAALCTNRYDAECKALAIIRASEPESFGLGLWYYRYATLLTFTTHADEALTYALRGTEQDPSFPWNWLLAAKLLASNGQKDLALDALAKGHEYVDPEDYEFCTAWREIEHDEPIEQTMFHLIDPVDDQALQDGTSPLCEEMHNAVGRIRINEKGLSQVAKIFGQKDSLSIDQRDDVFCNINWFVAGRNLEISFLMSMATLSKIDLAWLWKVRELLDNDKNMYVLNNKKEKLTMSYVLVEQGRRVTAFYSKPGMDISDKGIVTRTLSVE